MAFAFTKMHGCGNDFVIVDERTGEGVPRDQSITSLCHRRTGIGCDQLLILKPPARGGDAAFEVYNADGSRAEQCGNGMRCLADFIARTSGGEQGSVVLEGDCADVVARIEAGGLVSVDMGAPRLGIHQGAEGEADLTFDLPLGDKIWRVASVSMGNPHAVIEVDDVLTAPLTELAARLSGHWQFPEGVNVGVCEVADASHAKLRVHERGTGETLACGSGACAAVVALNHLNRLGERVTVSLPGGDLVVELKGERVNLIGPAKRVFEGRWPG